MAPSEDEHVGNLGDVPPSPRRSRKATLRAADARPEVANMGAANATNDRRRCQSNTDGCSDEDDDALRDSFAAMDLQSAGCNAFKFSVLRQGLEIEGEIDDEITPDDSVSMAWMAPMSELQQRLSAQQAAAMEPRLVSVMEDNEAAEACSEEVKGMEEDEDACHVREAVSMAEGKEAEREEARALRDRRLQEQECTQPSSSTFVPPRLQPPERGVMSCRQAAQALDGQVGEMRAPGATAAHAFVEEHLGPLLDGCEDVMGQRRPSPSVTYARQTLAAAAPQISSGDFDDLLVAPVPPPIATASSMRRNAAPVEDGFTNVALSKMPPRRAPRR